MPVVIQRVRGSKGVQQQRKSHSCLYSTQVWKRFELPTALCIFAETIVSIVFMPYRAPHRRISRIRASHETHDNGQENIVRKTNTMRSDGFDARQTRTMEPRAKNYRTAGTRERRLTPISSMTVSNARIWMMLLSYSLGCLTSTSLPGLL